MKIIKANCKNKEIPVDEKDMKLFQFVFDKRHRMPIFCAIKEISDAIYNVNLEKYFTNMFHNTTSSIILFCSS